MISLDSTRIILMVALVSALSRAGLHVIDRHQIGVRQLSIRTVNFWNNAVPGLLMVGAALALQQRHALLDTLLDWRTAAFAAVVQSVAYVFSYAFGQLSVNQVTVAAKLSDLFIPLALLGMTGYWDWKTFGFATATTLVCLPVLHGHGPGRRRAVLTVGLLMCVALVCQASVSPLLARMDQGDWRHGLLFATAVIAWRTFWCLLPLARWHGASLQLPFKLILSPTFVCRCVLTVLAQLTFILAVTSTVAAVAWPLLNTAGLFAMVMAAVVLRERAARREKIIVLAITALAAARFVL